MLVLVHIGNEFPSYMNDCIAQVNSVSNIPVHVLLERKHLPCLVGQYTAFPLDTLAINNLHKRFEDTTRLDRHMRGGFWKYATERFFYLYSHIQKEGLTDVFHIENDNLVYTDFTEKLSIFQQKSMWCVLDAEDRCIPSFVYFKNAHILERLLHACVDFSAQGLNDMEILAKFQTENADVGCLPIIVNYAESIPLKFYEHADTFGCLFDGACVGQFIGGVDPRNTPGNTCGFINEKSIIKCDKLTIEWRKTPFLNSLPLVNLHIHSKDLNRWISR